MNKKVLFNVIITILTANFDMNSNMTRLGGVPIRVPVPPTLAAYAMASIIIVLCSGPNSTNTAWRNMYSTKQLNYIC